MRDVAAELACGALAGAALVAFVLTLAVARRHERHGDALEENIRLGVYADPVCEACGETPEAGDDGRCGGGRGN